MANYSIQDRELHRQQYWIDNNIYKFDPTDSVKPMYTIDTPPPTVSGTLHI